MSAFCSWRRIVTAAAILVTIVGDRLEAQGPAPGTDSVTVRASTRYEAGGLHRWIFGDNYRDLWATPIKVPVLDLRTFAGGLRPTELGGGKQTISLRFITPDSTEYTFRPVYKGKLDIPDNFRNTIIHDLVMDARSASHPLGPLAAPPLMTAAGLLQAPPTLYVMPDDPRLGEFRKDFAGVLGTIEVQPDVDGTFFPKADKIISSDELLKRINDDPAERVDTRAVLTATMVDMLLNDNDRHAGQWKWLRRTVNGQWLPIARDRDKVFIGYEGALLGVARMAAPELVKFDTAIPAGADLFDNAIDFHRRLFSGLELSVWDSVAASVVRAATNSVLDATLATMPREYASSLPEIRAMLGARRDALRGAARAYYMALAKVVDVHGTDSADRATVVRSGDGFVDVSIQSGNSAPSYRRRFAASETQEIRLYLHNGDDVGTVTGSVGGSIPVRIIGGNRNNTITDASTVGGKGNPTHLYDVGQVDGVMYEPDSVTRKKAETDEGALFFNRIPWINRFGYFEPPLRDHGTAIAPVIGLRSGHGLGLVPKIGIARYKYGFRKWPYASFVKGSVAYSTAIKGFDIALETDNRMESSGFHIPMTARMTQLEVVEFRGFGNDVPLDEGSFYDVRQRAWSFHPAAALTLGRRSEVSLGPIVRYTSTDSTANRFISQSRNYGFGKFGQAGALLKLYYDTRNAPDTGRARGGFSFGGSVTPPLWGALDLSASVYPGIWDASATYEDLSAVGYAFLTFPVLTKPVLALRAGGQKLFGDFPYFDAAFIGGSRSLRTEHKQRYAGDASLYGTAELRVPIAQFPLILPLDVGALGFVDMARVYVDGESDGGWHRGTGAGFWVGVVNPGTNITVMRTNNPDRQILVSLGFAF